MDKFIPPHFRSILLCIGVVSILSTRDASAGFLSASLSLEPTSGVAVAPGETAQFDLFLRDYTPEDSSHAIVSFGLNVAGSDPLLTGGGADFTSFGFLLDPGLSGILGGISFDTDISDDGRVEFGADTAPFGSETGILQSMGDMRLGTVSVTALLTSGSYDVGLFIDSTVPTAGTFLLVHDGSDFGATLPGDGALSVTNSRFTVQPTSVVPEPASLTLLCIGAASIAGLGFRRRQSSPNVK